MKLSEHLQISKRAFLHLFSLSKTHMKYMCGNCLLQNLLPYVPIYFSALLIDALYEGQPVQVLYRYAGLTVGIVFLLGLLSAFLSSGYAVTSDELYRNYEWQFSEKTMEMPYSCTEDSDISILRSRIAKESQTGYDLWALSSSTEKILSCSVRILLSLSLTLSFFLQNTVPFWMKAAFPAGILLTVAAGCLASGKAASLDEHFYEAAVGLNMIGSKYHSYLNHYSSGKDIRLYDMGEGLLAMNENATKEYNKNCMKLSIRIAALESVAQFMNHALQFGVYALLIYAALSGKILPGSIARYASCVILLLTAASELISAIQKMFTNNHYLKRYFSYLDIPNTMYRGSLTVEKRDDNEYYVEFRDVSFRYPKSDTYALRHVNLKFKVGEKLAVVGRNGSGKTTFIKLMCRLYDPTEGEILLNGVNIQKYDYEEYMSIFSIVFQDFGLFAFLLGQNVAAGPRYDRERVLRCLTQAGLEKKLSQMPDLTERYLYKAFQGSGMEISGGEAQKIALARALYKDAPFLILDEPTAALDPVSEYEVYSKFNEIAGDKTAIYISHRLASCRFCDKIAVFHNGQLVQTGSHHSLLSRTDGKYHELWHAQAQYYTEK